MMHILEFLGRIIVINIINVIKFINTIIKKAIAMAIKIQLPW